MAVFVLIHGSHHGAWCWDRVRALLERAGHDVRTPTLAGTGERVDEMAREPGFREMVTDVVEVLDREDLDDVVLVGHSLGGIVARGVAGVAPGRIRRLVYLDGALLEGGESLLGRIPEAELAARHARARVVDGVRVLFPPAPDTFGIADPPTRDAVAGRLTPQHFSLYTDVFPFAVTPETTVPTLYVACVDPVHRPVAASRERADRLGLAVVPLATGHDAMIIAPELLADLLLGGLDRARIASGPVPPAGT